MAISKGTAQAAVNTLKKLGGSALASAMSANKHLFEKHLAKEKAAAAATDTGHPQGYIKRVERHEFSNAAQFKEQLDAKHQGKWLDSKGIKGVSSKTAR